MSEPIQNSCCPSLIPIVGNSNCVTKTTDKEVERGISNTFSKENKFTDENADVLKQPNFDPDNAIVEVKTTTGNIFFKIYAFKGNLNHQNKIKRRSL